MPICIKNYMRSPRNSPAHIHSAHRWFSGAGNDLVHQAITTRHHGSKQKRRV